MKSDFFVATILLIAAPIFSYSQEITRWRGEEQRGYYPDKGLLKSWPADGPEILWHFDELGEGFSSPAFANERIYITGMEEHTGFVYALTPDGRLIWKTAYGEEFWESYPGSRSTPVIAGENLYVLSGKGVICCLNATSGVSIWKKDLFKEYGGRNLQWGITETLVAHGNTLICTPGGKEHNVIALDLLNGQLVWSCKGKGEKSAYCSPLIVKIGSRNLLVTHTENNILGIDADKGQLLWTYPHTNRYSVHPNTPLYFNQHLFCFSGYGQGGVMLQLSEDGSNAKKKWFTEDLDSRIGGAVFVNGFLFGSGDENRAWQCYDWVEGNQRYESKELGKGVVITAENMLYCYSERGELALVEADPSGFKIASKCSVTLGSGQHWAHPVINDGLLYIRHGNALIAYKIK